MPNTAMRSRQGSPWSSLRSSNPALTDSALQRAEADPGAASTTMTLNGAIAKSSILVFILLAAAAFSWSEIWRTLQGGQPNPLLISILVFGGIIGFVVALITIFVPRVSPFTAPVYALVEGLLLGAISAVFESVYNGIVFQAVGLTIGILVSLLAAYATGLVRATNTFRAIVVSATMGIMLVYLLTMVLGFFGIGVPYIHDSGPIGIGFSLFVVVIAALNLVLDFDFIEQGVAYGAPKYMEWYAGFGLLVTLVWLYLEILRLLAKLRRR